MSSFLNTASSIALSDVPESSSAPCTKKKGKNKKTASVWAHTRQPLEDEDATLLYCVHCPLGDPENLPVGAATSSAMNQHIRRHHPTIIIETPLSKKHKVIKEQLQQLYVQVKSTRDIDKFYL